jgi:ribosome-binding protein aMBF1 (putative translation factor)
VLRIKYERLRRGWSQGVLAYHASMSASDVGRIESGRSRPYPSQARKLASAIGLTLEELLEDVPEERAARLRRSLEESRDRAEPTPAA